MGKVNVCLKWSFFVVIGFIGIVTALGNMLIWLIRASLQIITVLLLALTLFSHGYLQSKEEMEEIEPFLLTIYIFSILTLLLVIIGLYGACKEKQWPLVVFAVGMILISLLMIASGIHGLTLRPELGKELKKHYLDMLPLANASKSFLDDLSDTQMNWQCCGVDRGYLDWGYKISESCVCTDKFTNPCVAAPRNSSLYEHKVSDEVIMIYSEPCLPYLIDEVINGMDIGLGIDLGILLLWVLSTALCIAFLCQLNRKVNVPTVVYSQEAKSGNYIVLTDAAECRGCTG